MSALAEACVDTTTRLFVIYSCLIRKTSKGVLLTLRQGFELMNQLGIPVERVVASGGGTRHPLWLQLQADVLNRPIYQTHTHEAAAMGTALLAGVGVEVYPDALAASRRTVRWREEVIHSVPENVALYDDAYRTFCQLCPALKEALRRKGERVNEP